VARNSGQFQKGLSETEFEQQYGTEAACREALFRWRWPEGFECPSCGERRHSKVRSRQLFQCSVCRRQTSLTAGTIFAATKVPLRTWFRAIYHVTQTKQGISSIELGRRLGVTQGTAWTIKHKLGQVMLERDAERLLAGRVELDDAYLGGERLGGKRGRGSPGKTPFLTAVETTPEGKPVRLKLCRVPSFCSRAVKGSPSVAWSGAARWSATVCPASPPSPRPGVGTRSSRPARARGRHARRPSRG
jgi:transposase-like protein